jgi:DtxR family Mn-dependent transcriptional regulator
MADKNLTAGLEDYLEAIYIAQSENKTVKGIDVARMLNISRASVSEALSKLVSKGLITYESYGTISFTPTGHTEAEKVYNTHNTLKSFFQTVLNISPEEASENACKIEHIVSQDILDKIEKLTLFCNENPDILEKFKS